MKLSSTEKNYANNYGTLEDKELKWHHRVYIRKLKIEISLSSFQLFWHFLHFK